MGPKNRTVINYSNGDGNDPTGPEKPAESQETEGGTR